LQAPLENFAVAGRWAMHRLLISAAVIVGISVANPALANWWIVRSSDEKCLVVDIEPTGNDKSVTKVGKDVYQTAEQAEADIKRLCKENSAK
jgi:SepF-like predicted cell division protein (DUF552 family)